MIVILLLRDRKMLLGMISQTNTNMFLSFDNITMRPQTVQIEEQYISGKSERIFDNSSKR